MGIEPDELQFSVKRNDSFESFHEFAEYKLLIDQLLEIDALVEESDGYGIGSRELFQDILKLAWLSFYYEDSNHSIEHIRLTDTLVASLLVHDRYYISPPPHGSPVKKNPLEAGALPHAFGDCDICITKNFFTYNLSALAKTVDYDIREDLSMPDYQSYPESGEDQFCMSCKQNFSDWISREIRENSDLIGILGGPGILLKIPQTADKAPDILEIITDVVQPGEIMIDDDDLAEELIDSNLSEIQSETIYNLCLAIFLVDELGFDDFWINTEMRNPKRMAGDLDVVLFDYDEQILIVVETTAEKKIEKGHLKPKQRLAVQLGALSSQHAELSIQHIYITCGEYPEDLHDNATTRLVQESFPEIGINSHVVSAPKGAHSSELDSDTANQKPPSEFVDKFELLHQHILEETLTTIRSFES